MRGALEAKEGTDDYSFAFSSSALTLFSRS